jgi:hypothetical protein
LSWFIAAQGHEIDPNYNDYLTSKWLGLIRPLVAGFDRPLTAFVGTIRTNDGTFTVVTLDSFGCTNGVFFPRDGSWIREVNSRPKEFPLR